MKTASPKAKKYGIESGYEPRKKNKTCYDIKYHIVWIPKYRKIVLEGRIAERLKEILQEISERYDFEIDTMEVMEDHVHLFLSAPPRYAPARVVQIMRSISAKLVFEEFPEIKKELWGGELWNDGYFVRSTGDKVTSEVTRNYIKYQHKQQMSFNF